MREKARKKWEKTRQSGKEDHILKTGVLFGIGYGPCLLMLPEILNKLYEGTLSLAHFDNSEFFIKLLFSIAFGFAVGCLFGWVIWLWNEWSYTREASSFHTRFKILGRTELLSDNFI